AVQICSAQESAVGEFSHRPFTGRQREGIVPNDGPKRPRSSLAMPVIRSDWDEEAVGLANEPVLACQRRPSSRSVAEGPYFSFGGQGRLVQWGSNTKLDRVRPSTSAPFPAPSA